MIIDDRIWEIMDEIITLKSRLNSDKVLLNFNTMKMKLSISYLTKSEIKSGSLFELERLYRKLLNKSMFGKSDFINNMVIKFNKDKSNIEVSVSSSYTDRKLNLFKRDIDMSNFDVVVNKYKGRWGDDLSADIKITVKK